jgi:uncharacterized damage-inducible protein DinB
MNEALLELYRHKTWATRRLIEHCAGLEDGVLDAAIPGTYGTIRDTLRHLVDGDEDYVSMLTGRRWAEPLPDAPDLGELAERIDRLGPRWEAIAADDDAPTHEAKADDGVRMPGAAPMAQAIHHADEHRAHVLSTLGALGLSVPRLDVWAYARSQGQLSEPVE